MSRRYEQQEPPTPVFDPFTATTEELKIYLGDFERQWNYAIARAPERVNYQGIYRQGELDFMVSRGAIRVYDEPHPHIRVIPPAYQSFLKQKKALSVLLDRRAAAKRREAKEQDKAIDALMPAQADQLAEDEIDVKDIPF